MPIDEDSLRKLWAPIADDLERFRKMLAPFAEQGERWKAALEDALPKADLFPKINLPEIGPPVEVLPLSNGDTIYTVNSYDDDGNLIWSVTLRTSGNVVLDP